MLPKTFGTNFTLEYINRERERERERERGEREREREIERERERERERREKERKRERERCEFCKLASRLWTNTTHSTRTDTHICSLTHTHTHRYNTYTCTLARTHTHTGAKITVGYTIKPKSKTHRWKTCGLV